MGRMTYPIYIVENIKFMFEFHQPDLEKSWSYGEAMVTWGKSPFFHGGDLFPTSKAALPVFCP